MSNQIGKVHVMQWLVPIDCKSSSYFRQEDNDTDSSQPAVEHKASQDPDDNKYKKDLDEQGKGGTLEKWPKLLDLQVKLPGPGESAALVEMRKMCPGAAAPLEEIEEACRATAFHTPF